MEAQKVINDTSMIRLSVNPVQNRRKLNRVYGNKTRKGNKDWANQNNKESLLNNDINANNANKMIKCSKQY